MEVAIKVTTRHFQNIYGQLGCQETFINLSTFRFNNYKKGKAVPARASTGYISS